MTNDSIKTGSYNQRLSSMLGDAEGIPKKTMGNHFDLFNV